MFYDTPSGAPPVISGQGQFIPTSPPVPRWRAAVMFVLLSGYVLYAGIHGQSKAELGPALPDTPVRLVMSTAEDLLIFAALFAVAWAFGRPSKADLYGAQKIQILTFVFGFLWSLALRALIFALAMVALLGWIIFNHTHTGPGPEALKAFRPKLENLLNPDALTNPLYALLCATWVSFILAGLREELWRAGTISSLRSLFPAEWPGRRWEWFAVCIAAGIFGIGHLTQGWAAVALTATLGLGLGSIMVWRRSLPEAVMAHGFFDALTFVALTVIVNQALLQKFLTAAGMDPTTIKQLMDSLKDVLPK